MMKMRADEDEELMKMRADEEDEGLMKIKG